MATSLKSYATPTPALYFAFLLFSFFLFHTATVQAASNAPLTKQPPKQQKIGKFTAELNQLLSRYRRASSGEQTQLEQQLNAIATERQQLLAEVVEFDPQTVLKYALPAKVQKQFPARVQEKFEQWVHAQGKFEIYFEDHEEVKDSRLLFYLNQDGKRFPLSVAGDKLPIDTSGHNVRMQGVLVSKGGKPVIATHDQQLMLAADGSGDPETSSSTTELSNATGEQRAAVFLVNFQDKPADKPWSVTDIQERFFTQISNFFLENSYQQTWLSGDVLGWYTLPINSTDSCDQLAIADAADNAALADNADLSQYDRYVYVFPKNSCSWSGYAMVGGTQTSAWVNGVPYTKVPAHEIGHNFGLLHAHGLNCDGDVTDTNCVSITYGDQLDTMGAKPGHFNAFQKERLGWLNQGQTPPIVTVDQAGSYAIEHYEPTSGNAKALKIYRDIDPVTGTNRWYYIEFRQPVGEDEFIATDPYLVEENITNGVTIRLGSDNDGNSSYLLDMTPESTTLSSDFADLYDPALVSGSSYTDSAAGLTITTEHTDSQAATVYVNYDDASKTCSHADPVVDVSPIESQWVTAGTMVDFTVSVSNQDSSSCAEATFDISAAIPSAWTANNQLLSLAPGETGSAVISVTSTADTADGFYDVILTAANTNDSNYNSNITATYVVSNGSSNTAPDAVDDAVMMTTVEPVVIDVLYNDADADGDAIYISAVGNAAKGDVSVNADGTLLYTPAKNFKSSDSFTYTISDGQASDTATVTVTLQSSDDGSDNNGGGKGGGKPTK